MGLLTDPEKSYFVVNNLPRWNIRLSVFSFLVGLVWLLCLVDENLNQKTYFSENALLPGLVSPEYSSAEEHFAREQLRFLLDVQKGSSSSEMPYDEIKGAFQRLGLEVYDHFYNFTSTDLTRKVRQGRSVYAILRASRGSSLESLVFSVPYRPVKSKLLRTEGGIAVLLSLAQLFRYKQYWAKDIIFVITENEHIGAKAWVEAYHGMHSGLISNAPLMNRAGSIQAAINLEISGPDINYFDFRIVGVNGQMPNLDLVNLVKLLFMRDGTFVTLQNNLKLLDHGIRDYFGIYLRDLETVSRMVTASASGQLEGNHAFFQQFNIQSLTLRGLKSSAVKGKVGFLKLGVALEGVTRSLNNLLERFHQSFFFYLLTSTNHFISIGLYMSPYGLIILPIVLTALTLWIYASGKLDKEQKKASTSQTPASFAAVLPWIFVAHLVGLSSFFCLLNLPADGITPGSIVAGTWAVSIVIPFFAESSLQICDVNLLKSLGLIEMIIGLYALSMLNFPLALLITVLTAPVCCWSSQKRNSFLKVAHSGALILSHPVFLQVLLIALQEITKNERLSLLDLHSFPQQILDGIAKSVTEYFEYGNWLVPTFHLFLLPLWIIQWVTCRVDC